MALPKIIILGAGLGGTIAAYEIRDAVKGKAEVMVVNDQECTQLFALINETGLKVFYTRAPVEYGYTGA